MWCGMVWSGLVWCGVVWCGSVWCGVVWCGVVWCGVVRCGVVRCGAVRCHAVRGGVWGVGCGVRGVGCGVRGAACGVPVPVPVPVPVVWCGVVWCGVVWCGVVWCGVVWCGVVWCGVVWCGVVWCGVVWCGVRDSAPHHTTAPKTLNESSQAVWNPMYTTKSALVHAAGCTQYRNAKTAIHPEIADHPLELADIVIGIEGDWLEHAYIRNGVLGGFAPELTHVLCRKIGKTCAVVTVPWQAVWTADYSSFGWPTNHKHYPGEGYHRRWFHCAASTLNTIPRQQSIAFTHPYTDTEANKAGFIVPDSHAAAFPEDAAGKTVGSMMGRALVTYLQTHRHLFRPSMVREFATQQQMFAALTSGAVDALYIDSETANGWLTSDNGFRLVHAAAGWSNGLAYGRHPEYGDVVAALNHGLTALKASQEYAALCAKYPSIACDPSGAAYTNAKTFSAPEIADHPMQRADIVIGTEADWGDHNYIRNGVLGGFDIELRRPSVRRWGRHVPL